MLYILQILLYSFYTLMCQLLNITQKLKKNIYIYYLFIMLMWNKLIIVDPSICKVSIVKFGTTSALSYWN